MNNALYSRSSGQGPDLVLLHGLFGQGTNLRSVARSLEADFRVHCLDLPDHGRSAWLDTASLAAYAAAVHGWMDQHELKAAHLLGHSLGGKVAMELALTEPARVGKLVVADMAPVTYAEHHQVILDALQQVAAQGCQTRAEAEAMLGEVIEQVETGKGLADALRQARWFPPLMVYMVAAGERSGRLVEMFQRSAEHMEAEVDGAITVGLSLLEPGIIIAMAVIVVGIVLSILLPILQLNTAALG